MDAGKLNKRVTIETPTATANARGEPILTWSTFRECWASLEPLSAGEQMAFASVQSTASHVVTMRWFSGLTSNMRIIYGSRTFNIAGVLNVDEANTEWRVTCGE